MPPTIDGQVRRAEQRAQQAKLELQQERLRAETERQRAERLAELLRTQRINPDEL